MIYRLLAMNIDGTILQDKQKLYKSVKEAIDYVQSKDVTVTLVTSRNFIFAKRIAKALKLDSLLVTHHGGYISKSKDEPVFVRRIGDNTVFDIVQFLENYKTHIRIVNEKMSVSNVPPKEKRLARTIIDPTTFSVYHHQYVNKVSDYLYSEQMQPTHIEVVFHNPSEAEEAQLALQNMFYEVNINHYGNQLIILPRGVSKLTGLLYICDKLKIPLKETVVIGSGEDDLEIIEAAGLGVAMGNAPQPVKYAADWVTRSNNEQGVDYMVKEHFRKQHPISFLEKMNILKK